MGGTVTWVHLGGGVTPNLGPGWGYYPQVPPKLGVTPNLALTWYQLGAVANSGWESESARI